MYIKLSTGGTKLVNARVSTEIHDEYMNLKETLRRNGYNVSLAAPIEDAIKSLNKDMKDKLKELNIDF